MRAEHRPGDFDEPARRPRSGQDSWGTLPLAVHRQGAGAPTVYVHGLGGSHRYFEALWGQLPPHEVIAPDLLGFGRSPKPRRCAYRIENHVQVLEPLVPRGALVLWHSAGAIVALVLVAHTQIPLRGLVLLGFPVFSSAEEALSSLAGIGPLARSTAEGRLSAHATCALAWMTRPLWRTVVPRFVHDLPAAVVADTFYHTCRSYSRTLRNAVVDHRVTDDLDVLHAPLLLVHGDGNRSAPLLSLHSLPARPRTQLVVLPGDHPLAVRRPQALAEHLAPLLWTSDSVPLAAEAAP
ncbi:MAG: alpha/beta fold hydrolase [Acidimicrobiales bacterium]